MDRGCTETITAIAARGEQIKQYSAEYLWPLLSDKPVVTNPNVLMICPCTH